MTGAPEISCERPWLVARFPSPQRMVSWSLNRPGFVDASVVAWLEVRDHDLPAGGDAADWFRQRLAGAGLADAVGMMTARNVGAFQVRTAAVEGIEARCVVTLGLNNGEHVGSRIAGRPFDSASSSRQPGTINILCGVSSPLSDAALLEAASIVTQARTVALVEASHQRPGLSGPVTGTGTDCVVMAAPVGPEAAAFAGMHTPVGEAIGASVLAATRAALTAWLGERRR